MTATSPRLEETRTLRTWLPLVAVCLGTFMLLLDVTIVNVALPSMASDMRTSFGSLQWVVDAYTVTLAALVLGTGSVADVVGHRRTYLAGLVVFALSSLACGAAPSPGALIAARTAQGLGAAAMLATTFALLNAGYTGRRRGVAYGIWGAVAGGASAIGLFVGGVLTDALSWRWVFFVNLPTTALAIALAVAVLGETPTQRRRIDVLGVVTFGAASGTLTDGLIRANAHGWGAPGTWGLLVAAGLLLAAFVGVEARADHPMIDLHLTRNGAFVGVMVGALLLTFSAFGSYAYTSIWLQSVLGLSAVQAGLTAAPLSAVAFTVSSRVGRHLHTAHPGPIIGVGLLLVGAGGLTTATLLHGSAGWASLIPGAVVAGVGVGLATPTLGAAAAAAVPVERTGMAAGALNTMRQLGFTLGVAVLGAVFAGRATDVLAARGVPDASRVGRELGGGQAHEVLRTVPLGAHAALDRSLHAAAVSGVQETFLVCGIAGLVAGALVLTLVRPARS